MRRTVSAIFTAVVAMLLSLVLAVPASAADPVPPKNTLPQYKYGFDYYYREHTIRDSSPDALRAKQTYWKGVQRQISGTVHPSINGPSYYLNQQRTRALNPSNVPLEGKIIEPGKTVVRPPSTYTPSALFKSAAPGFSKLLGTVGLGIGGTSLAPANADQIALNQGVSQGCISGTGCTADETKKRFLIGSCGNLTGAQSCSSIGGVGHAGETDLQKWFSNEALPFLDDLWGNITGQKDPDKDVPSSQHQNVSPPRGCTYKYDFTLTPGTPGATLEPVKGFVNKTQVSALPRPVDTSGAQSWDLACGTSPQSVETTTAANYTTQCLNKSTGGGYTDTGYFVNMGTMDQNSWDPATGASKVNLCGGKGNTSNSVLYKIRFYNTTPQTTYDGNLGMYTYVEYSEWTNPDPALNEIEDTQVTTSWDCRLPDGTVYTFSKSITKTSAAVSPQCAEGAELVKHKITASNPMVGGASRVVDEGGEVPGTATKYPNCSASNCSMQVFVDGSPCTAGRPECQTWPQINGVQPSRVQCKWGEYVVPTSDCNMLSNGYKTETGVVFDPHSGTWVPLDSYGNPVAPNPEPWNPTNPAPVAGAAPGTGTGTTPGAGTSPIPQTGTTPGSSTSGVNCASRPWSWNPTEWVETPVICALQVALVPKTDVVARIDEISDIALTKLPFSWMAPVMTGPGGGGCPNWVITLPGFSQNVVCDSTFTAAVVGSRGPLFGLVAGAMVWPLMRSLWYASIPILRVTPSSSK